MSFIVQLFYEQKLLLQKYQINDLPTNSALIITPITLEGYSALLMQMFIFSFSSITQRGTCAFYTVIFKLFFTLYSYVI